MVLKEDLLSFIWQFRLFTTTQLQCSAGEVLEIIQTGQQNKHAGPDFFNAKLRIGLTNWIGNIEIHVKSSDWILHGHSRNRAYDNVVLHVVYEEDARVCRADGTIIPTLVLKHICSPALFERYNALLSARTAFPCEMQIATVEPIVISSSLSGVLVERFEKKYADVLGILQLNKGDWDATMYFLLARSFGFKVNSIPFEMLASSLDHQLFARYKENPLQLEALIFGQAGFLTGHFEDTYPTQMKLEYEFLKKKFNLQPIDVSIWKFLRMRPASFPTLRLAQFAGLMIKSQHLFSKILTTQDLPSVKAYFADLPVHSYWRNHYHFSSRTAAAQTQLGKRSIENIIINTVCLLLFSYGKHMDQPSFMDQAFSFLEQLHAEKNNIIQKYLESGIKIENAYDSQALLELNKSYCTQKKCLNCGIGIKILNK
jgi:hypothetical protein